MTSVTESSFGARLRRAQDLLTYISGFKKYEPPRNEESITNLTALIDSIISVNTSEAGQRENYRNIVAQRQAAFSRQGDSVQKLLSPIKGAVEAQYGKKSPEATNLNSIIKKMRATKIVKAPADPTNPANEKAVSQSERSYGSVTQFFNDIVSTVSQFGAYNPSNEILKLTSLQTTAARLTTLNNDVAQKTQLLKTTKADRLAKYEVLRDSAQRIKAYIRAEYGIGSSEYKLIKGLKF